MDSNDFYEIDGEQLPRVTSILSIISKPGLYKWYEANGTKKAYDILTMLKEGAPIVYSYVANNLPPGFLLSGKEHAEAAASRGSSAHGYFEKILKGQEIDLSGEDRAVVASVSNFKDYLKLSEFETIKSESVIFSKKYKYAGTMDALIRHRDGRIILRDWKTSSGIYPEYALQAIAYKSAAEEMTGEKIDDIEIVRLPKNADIFDPDRDTYTVPREKHSYLMDIFLNAKSLWLWKREFLIKQPKVKKK